MECAGDENSSSTLQTLQIDKAGQLWKAEVSMKETTEIMLENIHF
jgi:hypothetical protein